MNHPAMLYYGQASNTLYISFAPSMHATGIELTDHILLRVNKQECRAVGITLLEYSVLAQQTDMGLHSFLLIGFDHLPTAIS